MARLGKVLVTGSAGHLGEGLARTLKDAGSEVIGLDILKSPFTTHIGSITDRGVLRRCLRGVQTVFHMATLHKPHVVTHSRQDFIDTNVTGTLSLLEEAAAAAVEAFVFTSTTSVFGDAPVPPDGAPAAWVTEDLTPIPKNIYGVDQGGGRRSLPVISSESQTSLYCSQNITVFPGARRQSGNPPILCGPKSQGQRVSVSASGSRRCCERASFGCRGRTCNRVRPIYHQCHHAIFAGRPARLACGRAAGGAAARPSVRSRICASRLEDVFEHRKSLCQRTRSKRPRLATAI
jgi:NAD dependent epimerase/dehydratase family